MVAEQLPRLDDLVFVSFKRQVFGLNRYSGEMAWEWKCEHSGYPALLVDRDRLIVSINGYTYCLDPLSGEEVWCNGLPGKGTGVPVLASLCGGSTNSVVAAKAMADQGAASTAASSGASS